MLDREIMAKIDYTASRVVPRFHDENCVDGFSILETPESITLYRYKDTVLYLNKEKFQNDLYNMYIFQSICEYKCIKLEDNELETILEFQSKIPKFERRGH